MNTYTAPRSRKEGLVIEELGDEVLIYDTVRDRAHTLNRTAALVWKLCDGKRSLSEIAQAAGKELRQPFSEQMVWYALDKLAEYQLLDSSLPVPKAKAGMSRREFITRFAVAAAVVPVIKTLKVPTLGGTPGSCPGVGDPCISASPTKINGPIPLCCPTLICCGGTCQSTCV